MCDLHQRQFRIGPRSSIWIDAQRKANSIDRISNAVSLSDAEAVQFLTGPSPGDIPVSHSLLRLFLHEATHHASFAGDVGAALAALAISSSSEAGVQGKLLDGPDDLFLSQRDDLVLRWAETVYSPIIEGTALLAEHDIYWGDSPISSHALLHAAPLYLWRKAGECLRAAIEDEFTIRPGSPAAIDTGRAAFAASINGSLRGARMCTDGLAQKGFLLRQPLITSEADPSYLLGYLAAKRAYLRLRRAQTPLRDPDVFLVVATGFWFHDEHLADLLLSLEDSDIVQVQLTLSAVAERLQSRWNEFYANSGKISKEVIRKFSESDNKTENRENGSSETESLLHFQIKAGARLAPHLLNMFTPKFMKHRLTLRHGMTPVDIETDGGYADILALAGGAPLGRIPIVPNSDLGSYSGTIELVRSYRGDHHALAVLGPTGLVAIRDLHSGEWNDQELVKQFDDLPSLQLVKATAESASRSEWSLAREDGDKREMFRTQMAQAVALRDFVHLQIAFPGASEPDRRRIVETLGNGGLSALFGLGHSFRELVRHSVAFGGQGAPIEAVAADRGTTAADVRKQLEEYNLTAQRHLGVDIFEIEGDIATSAI